MKQLLLLISLFISSLAFAQKNPGKVIGSLKDAKDESLPDATISVMQAKDSSLISFTRTSNSGYFEIKNLDTGSYYLLISYQGFETINKPFVISFEKPIVDFATIRLEKAYKILSEVVVVDEAPIKIKGDTLAYNANAFKTKPNATVEDLIKKLPGMTVERDGTVKTQGENVQKVYVDGKEFFGSDPKLATKNLTADMVDEVEVYDDMSEQAKFNKIDDGSRSKAINLKLKKDKKKGVFGRINGGYGTDNRYDAGITANLFKGATQVNIIAKANNTNNIGFSISDAMGMFGSGGFGGFGGGGGMMMVRGGGGGNFGIGGGPSGITKTASAGINLRDVWGKDIDVTSSYFYNHAGANNFRSSNFQRFLTDSTLAGEQETISENLNDNHRFNLNLKWEIDSLNSIIYQPNISFQQSSNYRDDSLLQNAVKGSESYLLNNTRTISDNTGNGTNLTNNLIWRRKLNKIGRTLSVSLSNTYNKNDREGYVTSRGNSFNNIGEKTRENNFRQQNLQDNLTNNYGATLSYTEPIARNKILEFNYAYNNNTNEANRVTSDYNDITGKYDIRNSVLSNRFENVNESSRFGTNFRVTSKKFNYQLGLSLQNTLLTSNNLSKDSAINQRYFNVFPTASFNYQFARSRSLRINYRGRTNQPSISQLQDLIDPNMAPYYRTGNPALKQEFSNSITLTYNFFDMVKFRNLFALISFNNTTDKIVDNLMTKNFPERYRYLEAGGTQLSIPTNMDGIYNITGSFNIGFPIKKMKGGNFNTNTRITYARNGNVIDGLKNLNKNIMLGEDLRLSYNYKEQLDLGLNASTNYTSVKYSNLDIPGILRKNQDQSYFNHIISADITYTFPKGLILSTDLDYTINPKQEETIDRTFSMWNASIAQQLFKSKRGEIKFSAFDLLNQNQSFSRNISDNYIEDVRNTVLQRFFTISFTYNLNRMGGKSMMPRMMERATRNIRIN